jgi:serine/threonine-protein kinase
MPINLDRLRTGGAFDGPLAQNALPASPPLRELAPGERVGPFRIQRELSRGGMGVVYLADRDDGEFAQRVALKWMSGARDREVAESLFRRERDILASLEHPGIARLIDGGRSSDGMLWFAMEFVEGEPIDGWCEARVLSVPRRVALVAELCDALAFAHQRLLIHRDIKPANVLVGADGRVKLLDFGIARLADQRDLLGNAAMTPGFASPEQWSGGEVTVASDVYQCGLLLARLLDVVGPLVEGTHATRFDTGETLAAPVAIAPARMAHLPRDAAAILRKATALAPESRYATIAALGEDLRRWLQRRPVEARAGGAIYRLGCTLRRHPWVSAGAAAAASALIALGAWLAVERETARSEARRAEIAAHAAEAEASRANASVGFITDLLNWASPRNHGGQQVAVSTALDRGAEQLRGALVEQPALRAELMQMLARIYLLRHELEKARPLLESVREQVLAQSDARPALRAENAGALAVVVGMADPARTLALTTEAATLAEDPKVRIAAKRFHASIVYRTGDIATARVRMEEALQDATAHLPADDPEQSQIRNNLAGYLGDLGENEAALAIKREAYQRSLDANGRFHTVTSLAASSMARTLLTLGRIDEAGAVIEADGEVRARLWGEQHAQYAVHLQNLARLRRLQGRLPEAAALIERAIALSVAGGEAGGFVLGSQYGEQLEIALDLGDAATALAAARGALDPALQRVATVHDFGALRLGYARALRADGQLDAARTELARAEADMQALPANHPRRAGALIESAGLARAAGDATRAARALADAVAILDACPPSLPRDRLRERARREAADAGH